METTPEVEFKEFEPRFKFETRLKYGWFHLKLYSMFKIWAGAQLKPVFEELRRGSNSLNSDYKNYKN